MTLTPREYVRSQLELLRNWRASVSGIARADARRALSRVQIADELLGSGSNNRFLDIGCGQRCQNVLVYSAFGKKSVGIDLQPGKPLESPVAGFVRNYHAFGLERAARSLVRQVLFDPTYYREMQSIIRQRWLPRLIRVFRMNAEHLAFSDESFDLVSSDQVWEHVSDINAATREAARVVRRGGLVSMTIALFPSLSGGHHFSWANPVASASTYVPPWDHLRASRYPVQGYLNRARAADFRRVFEREFDLISWKLDPPVGASLLTPELRAELSDYSDVDLLTPSVEVLARRS